MLLVVAAIVIVKLAFVIVVTGIFVTARERMDVCLYVIVYSTNGSFSEKRLATVLMVLTIVSAI